MNNFIFRNHEKAIRQVCYHSRYPLFASSSADGSVIVYHGRVYEWVTLCSCHLLCYW